MPPLSANLRGILSIMFATAALVINDTFMKFVATDLPPLQTLFMRGVAATIFIFPALIYSGHLRKLPGVLNRWALLRNGLELVAVTCFVVALSRLPIAELTAIIQIAPLVVIVGLAVLYRQPVGWLRIGLVFLGFGGALMVAQPSMTGISVYAVLGFATAVCGGLRDLFGRHVPHVIPAIVVSFGAIIVVTLGAGLQTGLFETWVPPQLHHIGLIACSGFFLIFGQSFLFYGYRVGETAVVAPFFYTFMIWAVLSGIIAFGDTPNLLAVAGMVLIILSGLTIVFLDNRRARRRLAAR